MKVIHFDTGKSYTGPMSGRHTICACGVWLQDKHPIDAKKKTAVARKVTCKNCLKKLNKEK